MTIVIENSGVVKKDGRKIAQLRQDGAVCDIRRHSNGFLYSGGYKVSVAEELLESLPDSTILQFTNMDTGDVYTVTVYDFRHWSEPIRYGKFEMQRACEIVRMNHTVEGRSKKRLNELTHLENDPLPPRKGWRNLDLFSR